MPRDGVRSQPRTAPGLEEVELVCSKRDRHTVADGRQDLRRHAHDEREIARAYVQECLVADGLGELDHGGKVRPGRTGCGVCGQMQILGAHPRDDLGAIHGRRTCAA
jgi:hypothetical protein